MRSVVSFCEIFSFTLSHNVSVLNQCQFGFSFNSWYKCSKTIRNVTDIFWQFIIVCNHVLNKIFLLLFIHSADKFCENDIYGIDRWIFQFRNNNFLQTLGDSISGVIIILVKLQKNSNRHFILCRILSLTMVTVTYFWFFPGKNSDLNKNVKW